MNPRLSLIICRHTQTDDNARCCYTGQDDIPLNSTGEHQANALALRLSAFRDIRSVVSSDLKRTTEVAMRIARRSVPNPHA